MGANASKTVSNISNEIVNEIDQKSGASAQATCSIKIGNIVLRNSKRSSVTSENRCGASASASMDAIVNAASKAYNEATTEQKTSLLPGLNINSTSQDVKNAIRNKLKQTCEANAKTAMEIVNGDIIVDGCEDVHIKNLNLGNAVATCGVRTVMQEALETVAKAKTTQATGNLADLFGGGEYMMYASGSSVSSSICCCCIILLFLMLYFMMM